MRLFGGGNRWRWVAREAESVRTTATTIPCSVHLFPYSVKT